MLIKFSNRLLAEPCCTDVRDGQLHLVSCTVTGVEMVWSPAEMGTLDSAMAEHHAAHDAAREEERRRQQHAADYHWAHHIYRTTEPGDPRRRGIGPYLHN
jgi:hypothetical protein